jgi:LmbE family N-acetylglucosaminyl deacetylase
MDLWIAPHNDDSVLFGCFTLLRYEPLVLTVTDSWIQFDRGESCTAEDRRKEDIEAMKILGCSIVFGGIRDDCIDEWAVKNLLSKFANFGMIYAPAIQGGNKDHDLIGKVAQEIFSDRCKHYTTYTPTELYTTGTEEIKPTSEEVFIKEKALECYVSQIKINGPHFEAVKGGKPEWFM